MRKRVCSLSSEGSGGFLGLFWEGKPVFHSGCVCVCVWTWILCQSSSKRRMGGISKAPAALHLDRYASSAGGGCHQSVDTRASPLLPPAVLCSEDAAVLNSQHVSLMLATSQLTLGFHTVCAFCAVEMQRLTRTNSEAPLRSRQAPAPFFRNVSRSLISWSVSAPKINSPQNRKLNACSIW